MSNFSVVLRTVLARSARGGSTMVPRCLLTIALCLAATPSFAWQPPSGYEQLAKDAATRFPQPVRVGDLIGRDVLQPVESQNVLGHVRELVRADDHLLVVIDFGGWFGFGSRKIAVPADGMAVVGYSMQMVAFTPSQLKMFPNFDPAQFTVVPPSDTVQIGLAKPAH